MKVLCLGGKGFIGSRLSAELISRDHETVCTNRSDGDLSLDVYIPINLIERHQPDLVVHLAATPGRIYGEQTPAWTVDDNTTSTIHVAQACAELDKRLCYISTSEVYGDECHVLRYTLENNFSSLNGSVIEEQAGRGAMRNLYAITKWTGELASQLYAPKDLLIIRPSMTYGPSMQIGYGRAALPTMINNFLHGEKFIVHRETYRSWCYIDDLVRGMADVLERGEGIYNVGRDDDLRSMPELARLVCDTLVFDYDLIELGQHDPSITPIKDISMARLRSLGWEPKIDIIEGIRRTADSYR